MKPFINLIQQLDDYFGAKPIGTYRFYQKGLLSIEDINDVDILIHHSSDKPIYKFIMHNDWVLENPQPSYQDDMFDSTLGLSFKHIGLELFPLKIQLHRSTSSELSIWSDSKIIAYKYDRGLYKDLITLGQIMQNKAKLIEKEK